MPDSRTARQESLVRSQFSRAGSGPGESIYRAHRAIVLDALRHARSLPDDLLATAVIIRAAEIYAYLTAVANGPDRPSALGPNAVGEFMEFTNDIDTLYAYTQFVWDELPDVLRLKHPGLPEVIAAESEWFGGQVADLGEAWFGEDDPSELPQPEGVFRALEIPAEVFVRTLRLAVTIMGCWMDDADQAQFVSDLTSGAAVIGEWAPMLHIRTDGPTN